MKEVQKATGKGTSILSGRALFKYDATLFVDDEEAADEETYNERTEEEEKKEEDGVDGSGKMKIENGVSHSEERKQEDEAEVDQELFKQQVDEEEEEPDFD